MKRRTILTALLLLSGPFVLAAAPPPARPELRSLAAKGKMPGGLFVLPPKGKPVSSLLVALHEEAAVPKDALARLNDLPLRLGVALFLPASAGLRFTTDELAGAAARAKELATKLGTKATAVLGFDDEAGPALELAFSQSRVFRVAVVAGADAPDIRARASRLRVLLLKGEKDRPLAGRESVERLRDRVEAVEFRELPGNGRIVDAGAQDYLAFFLDVAAGRITAGKELTLPWQAGSRGLGKRKAEGCPALVYFYDGGTRWRDRTAKIQAGIVYEPSVQHALTGAIPVMAPRSQAEKLIKNLKIGPGPALVVLGKAGEVLLIEQRELSTKLLAAALASGQ